MGLEPHTRLGAFEVLSPLGAGGMGEVYRARDTRLGRDVAVKVLPDAFSRDAERLARFEREAHLLASLNHPGIAAIHGIEESDGIRFLVLELVPGETLAERLRTGALRLPEILDIARQIAAALAAAHEHGVIHRDLKPANIQLTGKGVVKLLDFGLAKGLEGGTLPSGLSQSPTLSVVGTRDGVILGTAPYMSPEQARGEELDKRTDVWSFGCVLYETLSGRRAFAGATISDTIASILEREPDWPALPASTPASIRSLLRRCLQKDRNRRLREIADAQLEIEEIQSVGGSGASEIAGPPARSGRAWIAAALAGLIVAIASLGWRAWTRSRDIAPAVHQATRLNISLPITTGVTREAEGNSVGALALSPDGRHIVYLSASVGRRRLYLRELDQLEPTPIAGTEGGYNPFFSPDGAWLGFAADGKLKKVPLRGGAPTVLCDAPTVRGASWGPDGMILFGLYAGGLSRVAAAGGTPQVATTLDASRGEVRHAWPQILPDGRAALFSIRTARHERVDEARIAVLSLETGRSADVLTGGIYPRYVSSGHLLYWRPSSLFAVPFAPDRLAIAGEAAPVLEGVAGNVGPGAVYAEVAGNGSLVYLAGGDDPVPHGTLVWLDRQGKTEPITREQKVYGELALSPDGRRIAVTIADRPDTRGDLWVLDLGRGTWTRLTSGEATRFAIWSPEGDQIVFASDRDGWFSPFRVRADGTGGIEPLLQCTDSLCWPTSLSPDGKTLALRRFNPGTQWDLWIMPLDGKHAAQPFVATKSSEGHACFAPDGHWIAYSSNETGRGEIFVRPFPKGDQKVQISKGADSGPVWSRSGREIFYVSGDQRMMAVTVRTAPTFTAGTPQPLFEWTFDAPFGVSPDGQRFVTIDRPRSPPAPPQLVVIPDFLDELRARLRPSR